MVGEQGGLCRFYDELGPRFGQGGGAYGRAKYLLSGTLIRMKESAGVCREKMACVNYG